MRIALLLVVLGCSGTSFVAKPLPELVANRPPTTPIAVQALQLPSGEALSWDVHWHGMTIGRVEMSSGDAEVQTTFVTSALASSIAKVDYQLTTVLDRSTARPRSSRETLGRDGTTAHHEVVFDGDGYAIGEPAERRPVPQGAAHTLHTALGAIRAWAHPDAASGFLFVVHEGRLFHLTLARPIPETLVGTDAIKIACRVRPHDGKGDVLALTIWLTATEARLPFRIAISGDEEQMTADLVDT
jgi:hypothetical protein